MGNTFLGNLKPGGVGEKGLVLRTHSYLLASWVFFMTHSNNINLNKNKGLFNNLLEQKHSAQPQLGLSWAFG